jgi:hypothetical protein
MGMRASQTHKQRKNFVGKNEARRIGANIRALQDMHQRFYACAIIGFR